GSSLVSCRQSSSTKALFLMSGIKRLLERLGPEPAIGGEEFLAGFAPAQIGVDDLLDGLGHVLAGKAGAQNGADRGILRRGAAEGNLVIFLALLIEAQDA